MGRIAKVLMSSFAAIAMSGAAHAQYFKDKTITMVINYGAGGNVDTEGRIFERHLAKHIAGKPNIIVNNIPGAGGLTAINQLGMGVGVKDPSTTFGFVTFNPMAILVEDPALRVKMENFTMLAGLGGYTSPMRARMRCRARNGRRILRKRQAFMRRVMRAPPCTMCGFT